MKCFLIFMLTSLLNFNNYSTNITEHNPNFAYTSVHKHKNSNLMENKYKDKQSSAVNWSKANKLFPRNSNATIIDVDTKKIFKVKRTFGSNHADVEPLTTKDTKIIKEIWGGFNWNRRAVVVVTQKGNMLAGSMTSFPHAGVDNKPALAYVHNRSGNYGSGINLDAVKNNGVNGHMCIHFLNSKTHGSKHVNKKHQYMVKKSANYIDKHYSEIKKLLK